MTMSPSCAGVHGSGGVPLLAATQRSSVPVIATAAHGRSVPAVLLLLLVLLVVLVVVLVVAAARPAPGSRVDFLCVPCGPARECGRPRKRHVEESGGEEEERREEGACDPCPALGSDPPQPEPVCGAGYRGNGTDPAGSDNEEGGDRDPGTALLMCETDVEEAYFRGGSFLSDSPEVWLEVQLEETVHLNLVLYDQHNTNSLSLHPPTEPEEEEDKRQKAFYCCLPPPPVPPRPTTRCLIRLANRTALSAADWVP
ncbi:hypothetical protein CRUP_027564 [Coryphaenoides rupestris]|nr:hypothetical protein CRUP_027564 [Coryphaenoides rupestris]